MKFPYAAMRTVTVVISHKIIVKETVPVIGMNQYSFTAVAVLQRE
jgi:hypothetical protein